MKPVQPLMSRHEIRAKLEHLNAIRDMSAALQHYSDHKEVCFDHMRTTLGVIDWKLPWFYPFIQRFPAEARDLNLFRQCVYADAEDSEPGEEADEEADEEPDETPDAKPDAKPDDMHKEDEHELERFWFGFHRDSAILFDTGGKITEVRKQSIDGASLRRLLVCPYFTCVPCNQGGASGGPYELWMDDDGCYNNMQPNELATEHFYKQNHGHPLYGNVLLVRAGTIE